MDRSPIRTLAVPPFVLLFVVAAVLVGGGTVARAQAGSDLQTDLVADQPGVAAQTDPNLLTPSGLAPGPTTSSDRPTRSASRPDPTTRRTASTAP